jgi:hypothetical protein
MGGRHDVYGLASVVGTFLGIDNDEARHAEYTWFWLCGCACFGRLFSIMYSDYFHLCRVDRV